MSREDREPPNHSSRGWDRVGPRLDVEVREPVTRHTVTLLQVERG